MLSENLKRLRKAKGISQEELAIRLNVVRQTISKWEKGLSAPDSEMLMHIAEALDTSVSVLLGETVDAGDENDLAAIAGKLELVNRQLAQIRKARRRTWRALFAVIGAVSSAVILMELIPHFLSGIVFDQVPESIGVIGGADGPTAVFVSSVGPQPAAIIFAVLGVAAAVIGWFVAGRKE